MSRIRINISGSRLSRQLSQSQYFQKTHESWIESESFAGKPLESWAESTQLPEKLLESLVDSNQFPSKTRVESQLKSARPSKQMTQILNVNWILVEHLIKFQTLNGVWSLTVSTVSSPTSNSAGDLVLSSIYFLPHQTFHAFCNSKANLTRRTLALWWSYPTI